VAPADKSDEELHWKPPFCVKEDADLNCPVCEAENAVMVRECEMYLDGSDYEAYCEECHARLTVWASVDIAFSSPELTNPPEDGD
jgi:hypothetical protein